MKKKINLLCFITLIIIQTVSGCSNTKSQKADVVKIIKTRTYFAKYEFNKLVIDKPAYSLGYDKTMGLDFSWLISHFDKYNNVVYFETLNIDQDGKERVTSRTTQSYYSPSTRKLALIKEVLDGGSFTTEYIRDNQGQLTQKIERSNSSILGKTLYSRNYTEQIITEERYNENNLHEKRTYYYDQPSLDPDKYIKMVEEGFGEENYIMEYNYERSYDNKIKVERYRYYKNGKTITDFTTSYSNYIEGKATQVIKEGYSGSESESGQLNDPIRILIEIKLNSFGDIIEFKSDVNNLIKKEHYDLLETISNKSIYNLSYTYNERKDWTKLILSINDSGLGNRYYIVTREIEYIE